MAVKSTLPLRFSDVSAEFGRNTNMRLSDYLRGGAFVPDVPANSNVPTSLPIRLDDLLGAVNQIIDFQPTGVGFSNTYPHAPGQYTVTRRGFVVNGSIGEIQRERYTSVGDSTDLTFAGIFTESTSFEPNDYEFSVTGLSNPNALYYGPPVGSWFPLSSSEISFGNRIGPQGAGSSNLTIGFRIRPVGNDGMGVSQSFVCNA